MSTKGPKEAANTKMTTVPTIAKRPMWMKFSVDSSSNTASRLVKTQTLNAVGAEDVDEECGRNIQENVLEVEQHREPKGPQQRVALQLS